MNTVVTAAAVLMSVVITMLIVGVDVDRWILLAVALAVGVVAPLLGDPFSRTFWTAIDVLFRPLTPADYTPAEDAKSEPAATLCSHGELP